MVIRHSLQLLEQLHSLETEIRRIEELSQNYGLELDSQAILKLCLCALTDRETKK